MDRTNRLKILVIGNNFDLIRHMANGEEIHVYSSNPDIDSLRNVIKMQNERFIVFEDPDSDFFEKSGI